MPSPEKASRVSHPLHILMVCAYIPCLGVHGGGNLMFNLIRELSKRHHITVLAFYETMEELRHAEALAPYCQDLEVVVRSQNFRDRDPFSVDPPEIACEFYNRRMQELVDERLRRGRYDLIQCEYLQTAHFGQVNSRIPTLLTNHEVASLAYEKRFRSERWFSATKLKSMIRWIRMLNYEKKVLPLFSAVVVLTPAERTFLSRLLPGLRVYDHAMGVDCNFFQPSQAQPEPQSIIFVGNFRHTPNVSGVRWFIEQVWPRVRSRLPEAKLYVVGGHPPASLIQSNGHDNIVITGFVDDVRPYLQRAEVFVAPLFAGAGARTKVLEAWAMERPVVGTSLAFEGIRRESLCIASDDPEMFASRVWQLLTNIEARQELGKKARQLVLRQFSWESFAEFYEAIYSQILGTDGGSRVAARQTSPGHGISRG